MVTFAPPLGIALSNLPDDAERTDAAVTGHISAGSYEVTMLRSYEQLQDDARERPTDRL
jgi:hypothetical protein